MNQAWLPPANLQIFVDIINEKGAPLNNCWGFVDRTLRVISRPGENQIK